MAKQIRRQHVVSRFYLKGFADERGQIRRVTLPGDKTSLLSITDATVIKDFYTITLPDGSQSDAFERAFGEVEGPAADAFRRLVDGSWPIEGDHRVAISTWAALQYLRSEDIRSNQADMNAQIIQLIVGVSGKNALREIIEKADGRQIDDPELDWEWDDITKPGGPDLTPDPTQHLELLMSLLPATAHYFFDCQWTIFRFQRRSLATSDHPVSLMPSRDDPPGHGVGIFTAELIHVPLTRRIALTIQPRSRFEQFGVDPQDVPDFRLAGNTLTARTLNQTTVYGTRRYLYHCPGETPLDGISLPNPDDDQPMIANIDGLVHEKGMFHGMTDEQLRGARSFGEPADRKRGMTIKDLPWPIPGRRAVNPNRPDVAEKSS